MNLEFRNSSNNMTGVVKSVWSIFSEFSREISMFFSSFISSFVISLDFLIRLEIFKKFCCVISLEILISLDFSRKFPLLNEDSVIMLDSQIELVWVV